MKVRFTEPAQRDFDQAITYLLEHAPASASVFADDLDRGLRMLREHPNSAQETDIAGVRRYYLRRFRYSVYYTVEDDEVVILNIYHAACRRPWERS